MAKISSEEDVNRISKLRQEVSDIITSYYDTDFNLLRWIKGLNYNIDEAKVKLRNHLEFRRSKWQLDAIANGGQDHPINKHWQSIITGSSGKIPNTIVNIEQTGVNDFWGILHTYPINEILKARVYYLELILRRVMEQEAKTELLRGACHGITTFMTEHYVELVHSFVVVNAPMFISIMWKIVSPILPTQTRNKVKILGSDWREEILELANPDVLPSQTCPVENYYNGELLKESYSSLLVHPRKTGCIDIEAEEASMLRFMFEADGNFAFAIYFTNDSQEAGVSTMKSVYPRINNIPGPTYVPIQDFIECPNSGTYRFWFSNEHAWIHKLSVRYQITVINGRHEQPE
uniref:CRAL-TRIO domain-containing protein n=1 Tax=Acrobeloides nanus TaxID=290746 RepID=A0A914BYE8_9BILA